MATLTRTFLPYIVGTGLILFGTYKVYSLGSVHGENEVQKRWDTEKQITARKIDTLRATITQLETTHRAENVRITHELAEAKRKFEVTLANQRSEFDYRLRDSTLRANVYRNQAESGAAECRSLAGHAAELDRSLEQGRALVRELRSTLEFRDDQIRQIGEQLLNDRRLFNEIIGESNGK